MAKKRTIRTIPQQRTPVREQAPAERVKNFSEVSCGYAQEEALVESDRCLLCPDQPCVRGCPVGIDIPGFIEKIGQNRDQPAAGSVRPRVPAGKPVRRGLHRRPDFGAGGDRPARAFRGRSRHR